MRTGMIEGFYGRPFTRDQRLLLIRELAVLPEPFYVYAPKDDPWHRLRWREPCPEDEWEALRDCMREAARSGVEFVFGISPLGAGTTGDGVAGDGYLLREKARMALDAGATAIAILFDDIPRATPDASMAARQAALVGEVADLCPAAVMVCPTVYCSEILDRSPMGTDYLARLAADLPPPIDLLWTGESVVSRNLTCTDLDAATGLLDRAPVVWDNYLADDYCLRRVFLASPASRLRDLECAGYLLNPSSIASVALWQIAGLISGVLGERIPPAAEILPGLGGWRWLAAFHHDPWTAGVEAVEIIRSMEVAFTGGGTGPDDSTIARIEEAISDLHELSDAAVSIPGGYELQPLVRDLSRTLSMAVESSRMPDAGSRLERLRWLMLKRLPYEHPLALSLSRLSGCAGGRS